MKIKKINRNQYDEAEGLVVVIDVIRAFTTTAYAFSAGAKEIFMVANIEDAFQLKERYPDFLLMGEINDGSKIDGFNFGNSPTEISKENLKGKTLIQRTSSGTQGVVYCTKAQKMLVASFVVAHATIRYIRKENPKILTLLITGMKHGGYEDLAFADYVEDYLLNGEIDPSPYLQKVLDSPNAIRMAKDPRFFPSIFDDLKAIVSIDKFPFVMEVKKKEGIPVLLPIKV